MNTVDIEYYSPEARAQRQGQTEAGALLKEFGDPSMGNHIDPYADLFVPAVPIPETVTTNAEQLANVRAELQSVMDANQGTH